MLENLPKIWNLIKGRVITDLNLIGVAVLLWIVAHKDASVLPLVGYFPAALQPVLGIVLPVVFGIVGHFAVIETRKGAALNANVDAANAMLNELIEDAKLIAAHPTVATVVKVAEAPVIHEVERVVTAEVPALEPVVEAVAAQLAPEVVPLAHAEGTAPSAGVAAV